VTALLHTTDELALRRERRAVSKAGATGLEPALYPRDPLTKAALNGLTVATRSDRLTGSELGLIISEELGIISVGFGCACASQLRLSRSSSF
jgi:hypothetical protein